MFADLLQLAPHHYGLMRVMWLARGDSSGIIDLSFAAGAL